MQKPRHHHRQRRPRAPWTFELQPGHVALRVVCHSSLVGGLIGSSGSVINQIRRDTSCVVHCDDPVPGSDHRVIFVAGSGSLERLVRLKEGDGMEETEIVSVAQEAVFRVLDRMWEVEGELGVVGDGDGGAGEGYCGLLANTKQIGAVMGRGGKRIERMRRESGAQIRILPAPVCAAKDDELIQITGAIFAVKKAIVAVTNFLRDCSPLGKEQSLLPRPVERADRVSPRDSSNPHAEFFPHLSSLLPTLNENSGTCSSLTVDDGDLIQDSRATRWEVSFRLLCSNGAAGSIIGKSGVIVRALQNQTGASIKFASPITMSGERVVTVSALENLESWYSPAQNALVLVFARSIEHNIENGHPSGLTKGTAVTARLLVASYLVSCLSGSGDQIDSEMKQATGADICVLEECASQNDVVVQIIGEYINVQNALIHVTSKLRDSLVHRERGTTSPRLHSSAGPCCDQVTDLKRGIDKLGLSHNKGGPAPPHLQLPQKLGRGYTTATPNSESSLTSSGGGSELERSLHFLLPREVLNEVRGRSSNGVRETTCSGEYPFGLSPDSDKETVFAQGNGQLGRSNGISSPKLQLPQTVGTGYTRANPDSGEGSTTLGQSSKRESRKRTAIVANTTVELIVPEDTICFICGEDGKNLDRLRQISGAKIEVRDPSPGKSERMVVVSGTPDETKVAQSLLQAFILDSQ